MDRHEDAAQILARDGHTDELKYVWPLVRDTLKDCTCVVSGTHLGLRLNFRLCICSACTPMRAIACSCRPPSPTIRSPHQRPGTRARSRYKSSAVQGREMVGREDDPDSVADPSLARSRRHHEGVRQDGSQAEIGVVVLTPSFAKKSGKSRVRRARTWKPDLPPSREIVKRLVAHPACRTSRVLQRAGGRPSWVVQNGTRRPIPAGS